MKCTTIVVHCQTTEPSRACLFQRVRAPPAVHISSSARLRRGQSARMARADEKRGGLRKGGRRRADPPGLRALPHRVAGINGVAQIAKDLGGKADPRKLAKLADAYENSSVRRLGYLLELVRHARQAKALEPFAREAKSLKPLDPAVKPLVAALASPREKNPKWMLFVNERVEVEA